MHFRKSIPELHLLIAILVAFAVLSSQTQQTLWSGVVLTLSGLPVRAVHGAVKAAGDLHAEYLEDGRRKAQLEHLQIENIRLRQKVNALQIASRRSQESIPVNLSTDDLTIVCRPRVVRLGSLITLDRGTLAGIHRDDSVVVGTGVVGRVVQVTPFLSRILPLFNSLSSLSVMVSRSGDHGIASGNGQETLLLHFLPSTSHLLQGDEVVTDGRDGIFPEGLPVGKIIGLLKGEYATTAKIKPSVTFTAIDGTFIVRKDRWNSP